MANAIQQKDVQVVFEDAELAAFAVQLASTFICQPTVDGLILTICQSLPPVIMGTPESQKAQLEKISSVKAKVLGRFVLTTKRAEELVGLLQGVIATLDQGVKK